MTTNRFAALLADRSPVFDGGYGWLLQERGLPAGDAAELWNLENPEAIGALAKARQMTTFCCASTAEVVISSTGPSATSAACTGWRQPRPAGNGNTRQRIARLAMGVRLRSSPAP